MGFHIVAKRWFQRSAGNTYHSVHIYQDDKELAYLPFQYGYGEQWLQTALDWLHANEYIQTKEYGTRFYREELNGTYTVYDVDRKKDL